LVSTRGRRAGTRARRRAEWNDQGRRLARRRLDIDRDALLDHLTELFIGASAAFRTMAAERSAT
jgi:hypothetical protein